MRVAASILALIVAACSETPTTRALGCTPSGQAIGIDHCVSCATAWDEMSASQKATFSSPSAFADACQASAFATRCRDGHVALDDRAACEAHGGIDRDYHFPDG